MVSHSSCRCTPVKHDVLCRHRISGRRSFRDDRRNRPRTVLPTETKPRSGQIVRKLSRRGGAESCRCRLPIWIGVHVYNRRPYPAPFPFRRRNRYRQFLNRAMFRGRKVGQWTFLRTSRCNGTLRRPSSTRLLAGLRRGSGEHRRG